MLIAFSDDSIYIRCFEEWCTDRAIEIKSENDLRSALKAYTDYILNKLADLYDVNIEERSDEE